MNAAPDPVSDGAGVAMPLLGIERRHVDDKRYAPRRHDGGAPATAPRSLRFSCRPRLPRPAAALLMRLRARSRVAVARVLTAAALLAAGGCASLTLAPLDIPADLTGVQSKRLGDVSVAVAILTDDQARAHFGADLGARDVQALWISVRNASPYTLWFLRNTVDRDFYSADEVVQLVRNEVGTEDLERLRQHYRDETIRVQMLPGMITEGFVFLPHAVGGRYVDVRLAQDAYAIDLSRRQQDGDADRAARHRYIDLRFGFALPLPDGEFDYEVLGPDNTYPGVELPDLELAELRERLEALPCCAADEAGEADGDPLNVVIVGDAADVLNSLSRAGWSFTHRLSLKSGRRRDSRRCLSRGPGQQSIPVRPQTGFRATARSPVHRSAQPYAPLDGAVPLSGCAGLGGAGEPRHRRQAKR